MIITDGFFEQFEIVILALFFVIIGTMYFYLHVYLITLLVMVSWDAIRKSANNEASRWIQWQIV